MNAAQHRPRFYRAGAALKRANSTSLRGLTGYRPLEELRGQATPDLVGGNVSSRPR